MITSSFEFAGEAKPINTPTLTLPTRGRGF
jgi:hypothetical protein